MFCCFENQVGETNKGLFEQNNFFSTGSTCESKERKTIVQESEVREQDEKKTGGQTKKNIVSSLLKKNLKSGSQKS